MKDKFSKFINLQGKYLTSLLILLAMSIGQMWATDYTIYQATSSGTSTANVDKTEISATFNSMKGTSNSPVTSVANTDYGIAAGLKAPRFGGSGSGKNITIVVKENYTATITAYVQTNTANHAAGIKTTDAAAASGDLAYVNCAATETVYQIQATNLAAGTYYVKADDKIGLIKLVASVTAAGGEDTTAPTLASSVPANSATDVAVEGNIVLTMSENISIADASKFSIAGGAGSLTTASISASGKAVTIPYAGLANSTEYTLTVAAGAIQDGATTPNMNAAFTVVFTTAAPDPDYLLINQSNGNVNTTDFRTTSTSSEKDGGYTVSGKNFGRYIQLGGSFTTPVGFYETNKVIAYDAKTNSVTVDAWIYNKANSDYKFYISIIEEGATEPTIKEFTATKATGTKESWTFTPSKNATIYVHVGNNSNVFVCQVGITEGGTALLQGGAIGYEVNLSSSRFADNKSLLKMDGIEYNATSNAVKVLTSGNPVKLKNTSEYIKFTLAETEKVTIEASGTYSVTSSAGYDADKSMSGNQYVVLTAGTWYICPNGSNVTFSKLSFATPPTMRTITLKYADGATADGSIEVVDGTAAVKPADPTWAHHRFDGWYNGETAYNWSSNVTGDLTLTAHWTQLYTVTYAAGDGTATGDAPIQADKAAGEKFEVAANTFTVAGKDFDKWNDGTNDYAPGDEYTVGTANVTLTAQWKAASSKYTVKYMDGETEMGTEQVTVNEHPTASTITTAKDFYTFNGWTLGGSAVTLDAVTSAVADVTITLDASYTGQYASSINIEQWVLDNGKKNSKFQSEILDAQHYAYSGLTGLDSLSSKSGRNYAFLGQKIKTENGYISFLLQAGKTVKVRFGNVEKAFKIVINGTDYAQTTALHNGTPASANVYEHTAVADEVIEIVCTDASKALVVKQIMIGDDPAIAAVTLPAIVTYNANGGTFGKTTEKYTGTPLVIGDATPADDEHVFAGWFIDDTQINAAAFEPTKDTTLTAHYANKPFTVTYVGGEGATGSMDAVQVAWGTEYTLAANGFEKAGHVWSGWVATYNDGVAEQTLEIANGKITMPKYNVTVTAQWTDVSNKVRIVETDVKYGTFEEALAAVTTAQTIQMLQDYEFTLTSTLVIANKTITLDLNGKTVTLHGNKASGGLIRVSTGATMNLVDNTVPDGQATINDLHEITYTGGKFLFDNMNNDNQLFTLEEGCELNVNSGWYESNGRLIAIFDPTTTINVTSQKAVLIATNSDVISGNGTAAYKDYVINIYNGILLSKSTGGGSGVVIYHPNEGTLNISGGTLIAENGPAVVVRGGNTNVTGGIIEANGSGTYTVGDSQVEVPADGIVWDFKAAYPGQSSIAATVSGGEISSVSAVYVGTEPNATEEAAVAVSGGTFDEAVPNALCAENYVPKDNGDGTYGVTPKDGVCIIWANVGENTFTINEEVSLLSGTAVNSNVKTKSSTYEEKTGWKFNSRPAHLGITLDGDETFKKGDVVEVFVTSVADISGNNDKMRIFDANADANMLVESAADMVQGKNILTLPATTTKSLYLRRSAEGGDYENFNPYVAYVAVYRPMMPKLTAISFTPDGGAAVAADQVSEFAFSATLPNGTVLANLDAVTPTIVRNAAHATTPQAVITNEGAWGYGANTYRVMDKDGDYTDYTITLTEAAAPSAAPEITAQPASANYYECATIAALEVVATGSGELSYQWYLGDDAIDGATAAAYTPAVSAIGSYVYHCVVTNTEAGHPATSLASANATITIAEDPAAIKLIVAGAVNTTNFTTGVTMDDDPITIASVDYDCASFGSTGGSIVGLTGLNKVVAYNATTTQTKVKFVLYNTNNAEKELYLQKVLEGATEAVVETIAVPSKEYYETQYYEYNSSELRSFYVTVNSTNIKILQVKVIDNGTVLKRAGEVGYELNLNQGRVLGAQNTATAFEGLAFEPSSNAKVLNSTELPIVKPLSFTITAPLTLSVTTSSAKYYVSKSATEDGTTATAITVAGTEEFNLTLTGTDPTTWYIVPSTTSAVKLTNIAFELPKAATPVIETQPATSHTFDPGDMTATVVATVSEGTLHYQWYKKATVGDDEEVGTDAATLTTTTEGTYYVVVTNVLAGHQNVSVTSDEATLGYRVTNDATLMALSYGTPATAITLEDGVYTYAVELAKGTTDVPALAATATMNGYATVTISNAPAFVNYAASSTVTVKSEDATVTNVYTVNFTVKYDLPQVSVYTTTTWDWANAAETMQKILPETKDVEQLMANIDDEGKQLKNDAEFNSQALIFSGQEALEKSGSGANTRWFAKGGHIKFNVTVPGTVEVEFSDNGNNNRRVKINDAVSTVASANNTDVKTYKAYVQPGEVTLMGVKNDGTGTDQYIRISKITFTANPTPDYSRDVTNNIGTLCVDHNVLAGGFLGATFYQIASRNEQYDYKIDFEEVLPGEELKAGEPYIFKSTTGRIDLYYGETVADEPVAVRGMIGNYAAGHLDITEENKADILYIANNKLWTCEDLVGTGLTLNPNRAYIQMSAVPTYAAYHNQQPNNAPIRRLLTISGDNAPAVITGVEDLNVGDQPVKVMIDGQMFILRGEKMYDAQGRLVK